MKRGIEVEGRFKGLRTLFMTAGEFLTTPIDCTDVEHLYISDHDCKVFADDVAFKEWPALPITLEVTTAYRDRKKYNKNVHFMLAIPSPSFWQLKGTDQIKFTSPNRMVMCATVENMSRTLPDDFDGDVQL